jgi:putative ATPase
MKNLQPPLSERLRPQSFDEIVGQSHLLGEEGFITRTIRSGQPLSIILWGPPGSGKTSIARLYAKAFEMRFHSLSAIFSGIADIKQIVKEAEERPLFGRGTILFVDEIHRFNKSQQDAFLPFLEKGTIVLIGATIENPSFYLNDALLSRMRVLKLNPLDEAALKELLQRFEAKIGKLRLDEEARDYLIQLAQGDGRYLFNLIENVQNIPGEGSIGVATLDKALQKRPALYDRAGEQHYNLISAMHKAIRGSDPDAALYWFSRMLEGGEDPLFIARRLIRAASEDIGQADPQALPLAMAATDAYQMLGSPEGELALAQLAIYLALAPKSNATYNAYNEARRLAAETGHLAPPSIILNAPTKLMKELGYGKGYIYDHDSSDAFSGQNYFPDKMDRPSFYNPVERGFEREMKKRLDYFERLRNQINNS